MTLSRSVVIARRVLTHFGQSLKDSPYIHPCPMYPPAPQKTEVQRVYHSCAKPSGSPLSFHLTLPLSLNARLDHVVPTLAYSREGASP
jgi:hypothetical protein